MTSRNLVKKLRHQQKKQVSKKEDGFRLVPWDQTSLSSEKSGSVSPKKRELNKTSKIENGHPPMPKPDIKPDPY